MAFGVPQAGSIVIADPGNTTTTPANATAQKVVAWQGRERVVELNCSVSWLNDAVPAALATLVTYPSAEASACCGSWNAGGSNLWEPYNAGAFVIEYGRQGITRRLVCDLRSMRLYLGLCDFVTVTAYRWRLTAWVTVYGSMSVSASVDSATGGAYDEATATLIGAFAAAAPVSRIFWLPRYARWWTPIVTPQVAGTTLWGGTDPALRFGGAGGQDVIVDVANYRWVPPLARFEMGIPYSAFSVSSGGTNLVTAQWIGARFYLCA